MDILQVNQIIFHFELTLTIFDQIDESMMNGLSYGSTIDIYYIDRSFCFHHLCSFNKTGFSFDKTAITDFGLFLTADSGIGGFLIF